MGPKNACRYADLAIEIIDKKAKSEKIQPNLWWRYGDDIFDLWTQGPANLDEFTHYINSLYPTIKFTLVSSPNSLNVLDLTLNLVDGFIETDIYSKPTDNHIYLLRNSAHPAHVTRAIPYGVATRIRRNCSTDEAFSKRSSEYKGYLYNRGYNPNLVSKHFEKAQSIPRQTLLQLQPKESKQFFPLVLDTNPRLPSIGKIIRKYKHLIYDSPSLGKIFPVGSIIPAFRRTKNIKEILSSKPREQHCTPDNSSTLKRINGISRRVTD